jgi:hydroxyquinol 1,2-dioxygenase
MRPAHVHFLVNAPGFEPLITHVFVEGDAYLNSDAVFGVKDALVSKVERHDDPIMPDGSRASGLWYVMSYEFRVRPGAGHVPQPLMAAAAE